MKIPITWVPAEPVIWCEECGAAVPRQHVGRASARRRLVAPLIVPLYWLAAAALRLRTFIIDWADAPARRDFEQQQQQQRGGKTRGQ